MFRGSEVLEVRPSLHITYFFGGFRNINHPEHILPRIIQYLYIDAVDELDAFVAATEWLSNQLREQKS
jgi:hypothetical protein